MPAHLISSHLVSSLFNTVNERLNTIEALLRLIIQLFIFVDNTGVARRRFLLPHERAVSPYLILAVLGSLAIVKWNDLVRLIDQLTDIVLVEVTEVLHHGLPYRGVFLGRARFIVVILLDATIVDWLL